MDKKEISEFVKQGGSDAITDFILNLLKELDYYKSVYDSTIDFLRRKKTIGELRKATRRCINGDMG